MKGLFLCKLIFFCFLKLACAQLVFGLLFCNTFHIHIVYVFCWVILNVFECVNVEMAVVAFSDMRAFIFKHAFWTQCEMCLIYLLY